MTLARKLVKILYSIIALPGHSGWHCNCESQQAMPDVYKGGSLKSQARQKQGTGVTCRAAGRTKTLSNMVSPHRDDQSMRGLFDIFPHKMSHFIQTIKHVSN